MRRRLEFPKDWGLGLKPLDILMDADSYTARNATRQEWAKDVRRRDAAIENANKQ